MSYRIYAIVDGQELGVIDFPPPSELLLGKDDSSHICVQDNRIEDCQCSIRISNGRIEIQNHFESDVVAFNGSPFSETECRPGDVLRVGDTEFHFIQTGAHESDDAPAREDSGGFVADMEAPEEPPAPPPPPFGSVKRFRCAGCRVSFAESEIKRRMVGGKAVFFCPKCGGRCESIEALASRSSSPNLTFGQYVQRAFLYPFNLDGMMLMVAGAILFTIMHFAAWISRYAGLIGLVAIIFLFLFGTGYLYSYCKSIIVSSAQDDESMPDWPDFSDAWSDIIGPCFQFLGLTLACFLPALLWLIFGPEFFKQEVGAALLFLGALYFPMALAAVAMHDTLAALNPALVLVSIARVPGHYVVVVVLTLVLLGLRTGGMLLLQFISPLLTAPLVEFISLYCFVVIMRVIGCMCYVNRRQLNWV